ncbi:MAG: 30S ribosomal protein S21 [Chloroflexi bacterium]|nr:30S ribosomal protein S21 [Chloroflexota bacterium]
MTTVLIREGEGLEGALRRFKKQVEGAGIFSELRRRQAYEKPSVRRKKKAIAARKRVLKKMRGENRG